MSSVSSPEGEVDAEQSEADGGGTPLDVATSFRHSSNITPRPRHTRFAAERARELRNDLTVSEARLWSVIRNKATGGRFRRQVPIGRWIVDFACLNPRIVIEVDDASYDWRDERERSAYLEGLGFIIVRFDNQEIAKDVDAAFNTIRQTVSSLLHS